ncbi:MAG: hypothetical protein ABIP55_08415 [Tepidisphaeraceae bacterium]
MPGISFVSISPARAMLVDGQRFIRCRSVEKIAPRFGEKSYEQLVAEAFDGPVLRLSTKLRLLEEADTRRIRRGDALELMDDVKGQIERAHAIQPPSKRRVFIRRFCLFAAAYGVMALTACLILSR